MIIGKITIYKSYTNFYMNSTYLELYSICNLSNNTFDMFHSTQNQINALLHFLAT
jgi:hypothetical protein